MKKRKAEKAKKTSVKKKASVKKQTTKKASAKKVKKWIDTPDLKRNEKYILEWHDFVIELQEQLMKMTDESYSKKINLFVLQSFFVEPYDMQTDFYIQFENRLAKTKTVIRQLQKDKNNDKNICSI